MELTALIVEDEDGIRALLEGYLTSQGIKTDAVETTIKGLELLTQSTYDLVLTDLNQNPSGVRVYQAAMEKGMKAYIMTGGASDHLMQEAEQVAGTNLIHKPFRPVRDIGPIIEALKTEKLKPQS